MGKIIYLLFLILLLPLATAQESIGTFEQDVQLDLRHTITVNGSGSNVDYANITIKYPNNSLLASSQPMTFLSGSNDWNYTLNETFTNTLGIYNYDVCAYSSVENECFPFSFEITRTGTQLGTSSGLIYLAIFLVAVFVFAITLYATTQVRFEDYKDPEGRLVSIRGFKYVKLILLACAWLELLFIFSIANDMATSFLFLQSAGLFFRIGYLTMLSFTMPLVLGGIVFLFISVLTDQKYQKAMIRGIPINR